MASEDARYRQSTQYKLWSFSPAQLAATREKTNALARSNITETLLSKQQQQTSSAAPASAPTSGANTPNPQAQQQLPDFLTPAEELELLNVMTVELLRLCDHLKLGTHFRATAAVFFRRFYLTNSIMTYPPMEMIKTCVFFGCKAEGWYVKPSSWTRDLPGTTPEEFLAGEFLLSQGLRFSFDVKHPYRALEGAIMELKSQKDIDPSLLSTTHERARLILKFSPLVTDVVFHHPPSQIMLASLLLASEPIYERFLALTFPHHNQASPALGGSSLRERVDGAVRSCAKVMAKEPPERMKEWWATPECTKLYKPLLRKLRKCRDPDRADLVAFQAARRERALRGDGDEDEGERENGGMDGDVFGEGMDKGREKKRRKVGGEEMFGGAL